MSGIQGLSTSDVRQILQRSTAGTQSVGASGSASSSNREARLDSVLSETNLSDEARASLKSDLKLALDEVFSSNSGSFPPAAEDVESAVKSVFEKYGLDASALAEKLRPSGGGKPVGISGAPGGPPPGGPGMPPAGAQGCAGHSSDSSEDSETSSTDDATETLLAALKQFLDQLSENKNSSQQATEYLMTGLVGFSAQA